MNEGSYYALLQVDPSADREIIEAAYRRLARRYHPDVRGETAGSTDMRDLNRAYETLRDPRRRTDYDQLLARTRPRSGTRTVSAGTVTETTGVRRVAGRLDSSQYRAASSGLVAEAALAMAQWATVWSDCLDLVVAGDARGYRRATDAGEQCARSLGSCLQRWDALNAPAEGQRLTEIGSACLGLQIALVRGSLLFSTRADFDALAPLGGLARRIQGLSRTVAAEAVLLGRL